MLSALSLAALLATAGPVGAGPEPSASPLSADQMREASSIFDSTWSPFCKGRTLSSCTSGQAAEWREDIRAWLAEGLDRDQIRAKLQARVPDFTLETIPDRQGIRLGPWFLGGFFVVALGVLGWKQSQSSSDPEAKDTEKAPSEADPDRKRLAAELEDLEA